MIKKQEETSPFVQNLISQKGYTYQFDANACEAMWWALLHGGERLYLG